MARERKKSMFDEMREAMGEKPTQEAHSRQTPTDADNVRDTPTDADDSELVRVSGRVVRWQRDALERIAKREGRLLSDVLREAIREFLRGRG